MIEAIIYDMDGILVDSEPFWRIAMIKGFNDVGVEFTEEDCRLTTGQRFDEVVEFWYHKKPWQEKSVKQLEKDVIDNLCEMLMENGKAMTGVEYSLDLAKKHQLKIGLATSSSWQIVDTVLKKLGVKEYFSAIESAEHLPYGKPHPEVFLNCASALGIKPQNCLVIEDSVNGVLAGKAARMKVVAIPEEENKHNPKFIIADYKLNSLLELSENHFN